jgi:hypothetical protein
LYQALFGNSDFAGIEQWSDLTKKPILGRRVKCRKMQGDEIVDHILGKFRGLAGGEINQEQDAIEANGGPLRLFDCKFD